MRNIIDHGARPDGTTLNTAAINRAIADCHAQGGGTVLVPPGIFMTGTRRLLSEVNLHLDAGAVLKGSVYMGDYAKLPYESEFRNTALVIADGATNVSITGRGTIDGNGVDFGLPG